MGLQSRMEVNRGQVVLGVRVLDVGCDCSHFLHAPQPSTYLLHKSAFVSVITHV